MSIILRTISSESLQLACWGEEKEEFFSTSWLASINPESMSILQRRGDRDEVVLRGCAFECGGCAMRSEKDLVCFQEVESLSSSSSSSSACVVDEDFGDEFSECDVMVFVIRSLPAP